LVVGWLVAIAAVAVSWYWREPTPEQNDPTLQFSAVLFVMAWTAGAWEMLKASREVWTTRNDERVMMQANWLAGWLMLCVHVAAAFGLAHGWSHAAAFEHTERTSGVGAGIFVNYAFVLLWGADVLWLVLAPASYARRPRWVGWPLHGFLAFVTFNATVIYGSLRAQLLGGAAFTLLAIGLVLRLRYSRRA
jgi:hypothetical protein